MDMLNFDNIKTIKVRKGLYFNKGDILFFNTDTSKIKAVEVDNLYFIVDNCRFNENYPMEYKLKVYDINQQKINTVFSSESLEVVENVLDIMKNFHYTKHEKNILQSGDIRIVDSNTLHVKSQYLQVDFYIQRKVFVKCTYVDSDKK